MNAPARHLNTSSRGSKTQGGGRRRQTKRRKEASPLHRYHGLTTLFGIAFVILLGRAAYLQIMHTQFLQEQGEARLMRVIPIPAHRGKLLDRNNEPLAVSTPVSSVWFNPSEIIKARSRWPELLSILGLPGDTLEKLMKERMNRDFVYLKRHLSPSVAEKIKALEITGVFLQHEYRRFYPAAEVTAHVLGFTNVDDSGQEGLELAFEETLKGMPGSRRVIQDQRGRVIADVERLQPPRAGRDITLSLDRRVAYLAYRELAAAVKAHQARSGSIVVVDARSGEVLALCNQPAYNPNKRGDRISNKYRNRAVTDVFEPGSTMKPFTIAAALESKRYNLNSIVNTHPGTLKIGRYTIRDTRDYGKIDLAMILQKSSNVGAGKIALSLEREHLWNIFGGLGFGNAVGSGFPGEVSGTLEYYRDWSPSRHAGLGFGYGLNATLLQLAQAYTVLANDGVLTPLRFTRYDSDLEGEPQSRRVLSADTARAVRNMLRAVVSPGGTGSRAQVANYQVAGKTGTVHKAVAGGYAKDRYIALFSGIAPASQPHLVVSVLLNEPGSEAYYGGEVAAPVFSRVMGGALRLLDIAPEG